MLPDSPSVYFLIGETELKANFIKNKCNNQFIIKII